MNGSDAGCLIVDDDAQTRFTLSRLMTRRGWKVSTAATVAEGLRALASAPACVILDLILPDGNGERVLSRIREAGLSARVVVNTGTSDEALVAAVSRLKPDAIVRKPVELNRLLEACSAYIGQPAPPKL